MHGRREQGRDGLRRDRERTEERGGGPAPVEGTERGDESGLLWMVSGHGKEGLRELSPEFSEGFEEEKPAFSCQTGTRGGGESRFFGPVGRENV